MNRAWAPGWSRSCRSFVALKSWNVGTTRTPRAWAAFVTARAARLTYARYPVARRSRAPFAPIGTAKKAIVDNRP